MRFILENRMRFGKLLSRGCLLSFAEGLPVIILGAYRLRRSVISNYIAGIPELVRPGENGWLIPAERVDQLHEALCLIMERPVDDLNEMGIAGQRPVRSHHRVVDLAEQLSRLFTTYVTDVEVVNNAEKARYTDEPPC